MEGERNGRKRAKGMEESQGKGKERDRRTWQRELLEQLMEPTLRNATLLELSSYMKIRFSSYKNKLI